MTLHPFPRRPAQVLDFRTGRPIHPDTVAAFVRFDRNRNAYNDRLAELVVEAENVLDQVAADLLKAEAMGEPADPESRGIQRALVRRAGETIVRFRRPELLASVQVGSARP